MSDNNTPIVIATFVIMAIMGLIYITPSIIAFRRGHPNRWLITVINVAFGGTIIGWGVALVWALHAVHRVNGHQSGGESGLNVFVNDPKKVEIVTPPPVPTGLAGEIQRLHDLKVNGALTDTEFAAMKAQLLQQPST